MNRRDITLWLDERWYRALSRQLENETIEDKLNAFLDTLIDQLPEQVREQVSTEIREEEQQRKQEVEASKNYSALRVTEHGITEYSRIARPVEVLEMAQCVRRHLRKEHDRDSFHEMLHGWEQISGDEFERMAVSLVEGECKITDVYDLDFDKRELSIARSGFGWLSYKVSDISTAAWHAYRTGSYDKERRQARFTSKLMGKEILSAGHLSSESISLAEEICEMDGQRLNFYLDTGFDVDAVFGTHVCTAENDDTLNIYAEYDMASGQVCDMLEVDLHWADGREESLEYRLNAVEKVVLLWKMDDYCQQQTGQTLEKYSRQLMAEDVAPSIDPVM